MLTRRRTASRHGMTLRSASRPIHWNLLSPDIRYMILQTITQQKHPGWASLAAVCKEWQLVIEKSNFRRLKLGASCLEDFGRMVVRQRLLVRHIWLDVELQTYTCLHCNQMEGIRYQQRNSRIFTDAVYKLLSILSSWKSPQGLTLELNAHSLSDSDHWFKNYYFASDEQDYANSGPKKPSGLQPHDPEHNWVNGQLVRAPPIRAVFRLFGGNLLGFKTNKLPQVEVVSRIIVRRQLRRRICPYSLRMICNKLTCLEDIVYEAWHDSLFSCDTDYLFLIKKGPTNVTSLKRLIIFEDFNNVTTAVSSVISAILGREMGKDRILDPRLKESIAARSIDLEELSVSYLINAEDFFQECRPAWTWPHLQSLALTSTKLLQPTKHPRETQALLRKVATVALRMPKLHTLVIWSGFKDNACAFIYQTKGGRASITWRSTWDLELGPRLIELWESVALKQASGFQVNKEVIGDVIRSHGDAIHFLDLPCQVVTPLSLWQIRMESNW